MDAAEDRGRRVVLPGRAEARNELAERGRTAGIRQAVRPGVVDVFVPQPRRDREVAQQEAVLGERRHRGRLAEVVLGERAGAGARAGAVHLQALLFFPVQAQARVELARDTQRRVVDAHAGLDAVLRVVAKPALDRSAGIRVDGRSSAARCGEADALAVGRGACLAPPVAAESRVVQIGRQLGAARERDVVRGRGPRALRVEVVVAERVVAGAEVPVLGVGDAGVRHPRLLDVVAQAERHGLLPAERDDLLQIHVREFAVRVVPRAVAVLAHQVEQETVAAELRACIEEPAVAGRQRDRTAEVLRGRRRDVVDDAADRLRAVEHLARSLQHLDAVEALDGRVVIRGVVAVGRVRQRDAVLEQRELRGPRRVQAADPDVRAQAHAFLVAGIDARDLPQRLVRREDAGRFEGVAVDRVGRSGDPVEVFLVTDDVDARRAHVVGGKTGGRCEGGDQERQCGAATDAGGHAGGLRDCGRAGRGGRASIRPRGAVRRSVARTTNLRQP